MNPELIRIENGDRGKFLGLNTVHFKDKNGKERAWEFVSRREAPVAISKNTFPDAVIIVPVSTVRDKVYMIREFRPAIMDYEIGFPAGLIDPSESIITAARRELLEETGLSLRKILSKSPKLLSSSGITDEIVTIIIAEVVGTPSTKNNEENEDIGILELTREEAIEMSSDLNVLMSAKAWGILKMFQAMEMNK